jgi:hypothetical protein
LAQKAKPYTDKIGSYFQRFSPEALKYIIWAAIAVVSFSFGLIIGCENSQGPKFRFFSQDLGTTEVIDSFIAVMPEGANVIARFNDERHSLYYLKSGHLMRFNAQSKMLEEVTPETSNANMEIYYDDMDEQSGIIAAKLSKDEKFILFTAVTHRRNSETEPLQTRNYQLNTESLNMLTYDGKALDPPPAKKDTVKVQKPRPRVEESSEASAESATGTETTVIPAAEPQQTEPKPAEPKPAEPAPAPKTQENTTTPSE